MYLKDEPRQIKSASGEPTRNSYIFLVVIFVAILIDAFLFAQVHANYLHDHGYDVQPLHFAVAKPPPP